MKRRMLWLCLLLAVAVCLSVCGLGEAEVLKSGDYWYIVLEDGTAEITEYTGEAAALDIPGQLDRYVVTSIGDFAFFYCTSLTGVSIPDSITEIGKNPFCGCTRLSVIKLSGNHPTLDVIGGVLFCKADRRLVCYPQGLTAASYSVPRGIATLGDDAFHACESLTAVEIPDTVTSIGDYAFSGCSILTSVSIPESVTSIGKGAFSGCSSLTSVSIPEGVTSIGNDAFSDCSSLTSVSISESVTSIGDYAFSSCSSLTSVSILEGVTSIGDYAFRSCSSLTSVSIPASVTEIGEKAFANCVPSLQLTVPRDSYAAAYCEANGLPFVYPDSHDWLNE